MSLAIDVGIQESSYEPKLCQQTQFLQDMAVETLESLIASSSKSKWNPYHGHRSSGGACCWDLHLSGYTAWLPRRSRNAASSVPNGVGDSLPV